MKLDIDNPALELDIITQVLHDEQLRGLVSEVVFEMHYYHPDMEQWFRRPKTQWVDVVNMFNQLRSAGVRVHYWP